MLPRHHTIHYLCAHTYIIKNITMKQRIQNKNLARSGKTTVVMFVIQLFLLFDKTESCEPGELGEPGESGEPGDSTDSTDSMFSRKVAPIVVAKPRKRGVFNSRTVQKTSINAIFN